MIDTKYRCTVCDGCPCGHCPPCSTTLLIVLATIDWFASGCVLIVGVKDEALRQNNLAVVVAALVANAVRDMTGKKTPFVATAEFSGHFQEQHAFFRSPIPCPLSLRFKTDRMAMLALDARTAQAFQHEQFVRMY